MTTKGGYREGKIYPSRGIIQPTIYRSGEKQIVLGNDFSNVMDGTDVTFLTVPHAGSTTRAVDVAIPRKTKEGIGRPSLRPLS